ncbi:MAG: hypothetical protein Q9222_001200 [Ikaeria aurantiellina]
MDGGVLETKRPLTPPADVMDLDKGLQEGALSNGQHIKDSSPNSVPTGNSTQATSVDDFEPSKVNGIDASAIQANHFATNLNSKISNVDANDELTNAPVDEPRNQALDQQEEGAADLTSSSIPSISQHPTSDLRESPRPEVSYQPTDVKEQNPEEDSKGTLELTNGSLADHSHKPEIPELDAEQAPAPATPEVKSEAVISGQTQEQSTTPADASIAIADVPHRPPVPIPAGKLPEEPLDPAPSPAKPADTSLKAPDLEPMSIDQQPLVSPQSSPKLSRPREDDGDEAPNAKRSKVEEAPIPAPTASIDGEFKVPAQPALSVITDGSMNENRSELAKPMTTAQRKHMIKSIQNTKRSNDAKPFLYPVDVVLLNIPNYPNIVKNPIDLRTIEEKLKADGYTSVQAVKNDFYQIVQNTVLFNGNEHPVTKNGQAMEKVFERQMAHLPGPDVPAPASADKKARKTSLPSTAKAAPTRRESRTSLPTPTGPSPAFAIGPLGIPTPRRDSTTQEGDRPKRAIHPPAPKDLPYTTRPKKKKYQAELKFCLHVLNEIAKPRYTTLTQLFATPVDPVALNIPDYHSVIKKPMDLRTVRQKLEAGQYEHAKEFEADMKLIFANCLKYNGPDHPYTASAKQLEGIFDQEMAHKRSWIDANSPASGAQSATSSDGEDDEDEDEEEEVEEPADNDQLSRLQRSIAEMSEQVRLLQQKKKSPPTTSKKAAKGAKADKKGAKKGASAPPVKTEKKAPTKHKKETYVTYEQKQDISNRINSLSEAKMARALKIIRDNMPNLKVPPKLCSRILLKFSDKVILEHELNIEIGQGVQDDELELDIDELSDDVLRKLWDFVKKNSKQPDEAPRPPAVVSAAPAAPRKKNKPMSKQEQERQIQELKSKQSQFEQPTPSIETAPDTFDIRNDTSGDEDDSEESEEE